MPEGLSIDPEFEISKENIKRGEPISGTTSKIKIDWGRIDTRRNNPAESRGKKRTLNGKHIRRRPLIGEKDSRDDLEKNLVGALTNKPPFQKKYPEDFDHGSKNFPKKEKPEDHNGIDRDYQEYLKDIKREKDNSKKNDAKEPSPHLISPKERKEETQYQKEKKFGRDKVVYRDGKVLRILR